MSRWVEIAFDCVPLRSVERLDIPLDASPKYQKKCESILAAIKKHGLHNTYYLHNARAVYHLTNDDTLGMIHFRFEGTLLTDADDAKSARTDLEVELIKEDCDWLNEPIVNWFAQTVSKSVLVEFDRYIAAGDLQKTKDRLAAIEASSDETGGFLGMYL